MTFDGALAVGSVRGYRAWRVRANGMLTPLVYATAEWDRGAEEHLAACHGSPSVGQVEERPGEDSHLRQGRIALWRNSHTMESCRHGFYAYYDPKQAAASAPGHPVVTGVIQGYGETLIGTKGFRCGKARILAINVAPSSGMWRLEPPIVEAMKTRYPVPFFDSADHMAREYPATDPVEFTPTIHEYFDIAKALEGKGPWGSLSPEKVAEIEAIWENRGQ